MTYVPVAPPTPPPSPRTRELAELLKKVLQEYTKAHPATTRNEIRAAFRMAQMSAGSDQATVARIIALTLGLVVGVLGLGLVFLSRGGNMEWQPILPAIVAVIVFLLMIVMVVVKVQSR